MSKSRVIVLSVVVQGLSKAEAARRYDVSWQWVHTLVKRFERGGLDALEPRSRRPHLSPNATPAGVTERIVSLRRRLVREGLDAGPVTIAWHLEQEGLRPPSTSTIRRVLLGAGLVTPEPSKRPKSSLKRFAAEQPNETWQSDFTHWQLSDGTEVEIINWLDDHSRFLLDARVHSSTTGHIVVETFTNCVNSYGLPASTLTDNGVVYTTRLLGARNGFEHLLATLGVQQKNGQPYHPQTQGKIERFHRTLKNWLQMQEPVNSMKVLQAQLDTFRQLYNYERPHHALDRATPAQAYRARPKAGPRDYEGGGEFRVRFDVVDKFGKISLRHGGSMRHLGVGNAHYRRRVLLLIDLDRVTVTDIETGEILATNIIENEKSYWRNQMRRPGRWPT